jgi:hypothetical protein
MIIQGAGRKDLDFYLENCPDPNLLLKNIKKYGKKYFFLQLSYYWISCKTNKNIATDPKVTTDTSISRIVAHHRCSKNRALRTRRKRVSFDDYVLG